MRFPKIETHLVMIIPRTRNVGATPQVESIYPTEFRGMYSGQLDMRRLYPLPPSERSRSQLENAVSQGCAGADVE